MPHVAGQRLALASWLGLLLACRQPVPYTLVRIIGRNYAYGVPPVLRPGPTAFQFINQGSVTHEFQIFRFSPGIPADSALRMLAADDTPDDAAESSGGILVATAGDTVRQLLFDELRPGDVYGLLCEFRDSTGTPKHSRLGMYAVVRVEEQ